MRIIWYPPARELASAALDGICRSPFHTRDEFLYGLRVNCGHRLFAEYRKQVGAD